MKQLIFIFIFLSLLTNILNAQFLRDNEQEIILDTSTMLVWEDSSRGEVNVVEAFEYCEKLEIGTYHNWRVPSYNELYSIVDLGEIRPSLNATFEERSIGYYWTSTLYTDNFPWAINFTNGADHYNISPGSKEKVRCVHNFQ